MRTVFTGRFMVAIAAVVSLSACQMNLPSRKDKAPQPNTTEVGAQAGVAHDVEAPELFKKADKALWDGRPSLGGVWVADTSVKEPQRVVMRNTANGRSVMGALFRREIDNPGPPLQLSADAAEALGILAGQPTLVEVVALKTVQPEAPPAPAPTAKPDSKVKPAPKPTEAIAAAAAAAIDKAADPKTTDKDKAAKSSDATTKAAPKAASSKEPVTSAPLSAIPAPAVPAATMKQPFIQAGIFSVEANANQAAAKLAKAGLPALVRGEQGTKPYWRVIVGPAANQAERDALAAKLKGLGYADAYPVKN